MSKRIIIDYFIYGIAILLLQNNCIGISIDSPIERSYNPQKAGAEIIESYDLEKLIKYDKYYSICMAYYDNFYYISSNKKIYVIRKDDFKVNNIIDMSYITYDFGSIGLSVSDIMLFSGVRYLNDKYDNFIFQMDLSGDNLKEIDISDDLNLSLFRREIGFNLFSNHIWIESGDNIINYAYDLTSDKYMIVEDWGYLSSFYISASQYCIYGDDIWIARDPYLADAADIQKWNKNKPEELLVNIDVSYLGTNRRVYDILYDGEYLWIIIEKDSKMQLLKLGTDLVK